MLGLLLLLQVFMSCLWLGHSEVVTNFKDPCKKFFYAQTPPKGGIRPTNAARICQVYNNRYRFVTLYDRDRRIPVYSAYIYQPGPGDRYDSWFVEPQVGRVYDFSLIDAFSYTEMTIKWGFDNQRHLLQGNLFHYMRLSTDSSSCPLKLINEKYRKNMTEEYDIIQEYNINSTVIGQNQAIDNDYSGALGLDRGHLCPSGHHTGDDKLATFTLTNIVPQYMELNQGAWHDYEDETMPEKTQGCDTTYVITGAVPGNTYISDGRVNVPSHIWSAACCLVDKKPIKAWGAIAENERNRNHVRNVELWDLENRLAGLYGRGGITLFKNSCA